jgi:CarD family transcriptional regulator
MPFEIGAVVVVPQHGICRIKARRKSYVGSLLVEFYVLERLADSSVVQFASSELEGKKLRDPVSTDELPEVMDVLRTPPPKLTSNWSKRFKSHTALLGAGTARGLATVVRNLYFLSHTAGLSSAERMMFDRCYKNLVHETVHVTKTSVENSAARLDTALQECLNSSAP